MSTDPRSRSWVEVSASGLRRNLARLRAAAGDGVGVLPLVKADAYGLGAAEVVGVLEGEGPWGYGVATVEEGIRIRRLGIERPILVFSPAPRENLRAGVDCGLTFCVSSTEAVRELAGAAAALDRTVSIHVEIDTGMGRSGFDWRLTANWGPDLLALTRGAVRWEGVFTHFHSADRLGDPATEEQEKRFAEALDCLRAAGGGGWVIHLNNSAGTLRSGSLPGGVKGALVRPGIFLYGGRIGEGFPEPAEVAAVRGRILLVREVPAGTTVGYGAEHRAKGPERWATVGIGYGDGLPRALGNRGSGSIRGKRVPIVGRISMDLTVVDISQLPPDVGVGETVTFIGRDGDGGIPLEEVAQLAATINYEILTGLSSRLPRVWVDEGSGAGDSGERPKR